MEKFKRYFGMLVAGLLAVLFFMPVENGFQWPRYNVTVNALDRLPASHILRAFDTSYQVYLAAKEYQFCLSASYSDGCYLKLIDLSGSYDVLLDYLEENYPSEYYELMSGAAFKVGVESADKMEVVNAYMSRAALYYAESGMGRWISIKIYAANFLCLVLVLSVVFFRKIVGAAVLSPVFFAIKVVRGIHRVI